MCFAAEGLGFTHTHDLVDLCFSANGGLHKKTKRERRRNRCTPLPFFFFRVQNRVHKKCSLKSFKQVVSVLEVAALFHILEWLNLLWHLIQFVTDIIKAFNLVASLISYSGLTFNTELNCVADQDSVKTLLSSCVAKWSPACPWKPAGVGRPQPQGGNELQLFTVLKEKIADADLSKSQLFGLSCRSIHVFLHFAGTV